jgi:hypothetical protein
VNWYPTLSPVVETAVQRAYGLLLMATLVGAIPHARRYFLSERWGGYAQRSLFVDAIQNPLGVIVTLTLWIASAAALILDRSVVPAATVNLALCWYFFVWMRWHGVLRGMGAPGFITFWLGGAVALLAFTRRHAPGAHDLALWALQVDFALIMISAGLYKLAAGYRAGDGMDLGMVNPEWGYWTSFWQRWPPSHPLFRFLNEMAWLTEVVAGVLMLIPSTRLVGGLLILGSFVFIATQIRLGFLCEMVIVCCLLFVPGGDPAASSAASHAPAWQPVLVAGLWTYVVMLPFVRAGMYYNQLRHRALPSPAQWTLDAYANTFGLILWRVFSGDVVNFFVRVYEQGDSRESRRLLSDYRGFTGTRRFRQVAECIAITSVFTTLKYYSSNRALFVDRLLRYARTVPHDSASTLVFEWIGIVKQSDRFDLVPAAEYLVDTRAGTVTDVVLTDRVSVNAPSVASPVHEGARPGSYAPLRP